MQEGLTFFDILLIGALIVFIFTRFSSFKLPEDDKKKGKKPSFMDKTNFTTPKKEKNITAVVPFPKEKVKKSKKKESEQQGLDAIRAKDPSFKENEFLEGAKDAYSMYFDAISRSDEEMLDDLTSPRVYDKAMEKVEEAEAKGHSYKIEVVKIKEASLVDGRLHGLSMIIDVKYEAEILEYTEDAQGEVITGSKTKSKTDTAIWTWVKPVGNEDPNWELDSIHALV